MNNVLRQPIFYGIVVIAIIIASVWTYTSNHKTKTATSQTTTTTTEVSNLTNYAPADYDSKIRSEYAMAANKAAEVNVSLKLAAIIVEIGPDLTANSTSTKYVFGSDGDKINNWMITISEQNGNFIRALIPKEDYLGEIPLMNTKLWKYNYIQALQLAEKNGGMTWREGNTLKGITLTLKHSGSKNWLMWNVEYIGETNNFGILLDSVTGKVVTE